MRASIHVLPSSAGKDALLNRLAADLGLHWDGEHVDGWLPEVPVDDDDEYDVRAIDEKDVLFYPLIIDIEAPHSGLHRDAASAGLRAWPRPP